METIIGDKQGSISYCIHYDDSNNNASLQMLQQFLAMNLLFANKRVWFIPNLNELNPPNTMMLIWTKGCWGS